jgi:Zn-dependent protease with chaperone function
LTAVIALELAHFRGDDTVYSLKFAPVYRGLGAALEVIDCHEEEGASGLAKLPALAILSVM